MAYDKKTWINVDDPSKFTSDQLNSFPRYDADNMNRIEDGIEAALNYNDHAPTYTEAKTLETLESGEKISTAFGKIKKSITDFIAHLGDNIKHNHSQIGGGAVGDKASAGSGGAVGYWSIATTGAAVGQGAKTSSGVALGYNALAVDLSGDGIDAIQLGRGENLDPKTLQVYDYTLMNEDGTIPVERMAKGLKIKTGTYDGSGSYSSSEPIGSVSIPCERKPKMIIITRGTYGDDAGSFAIGIILEESTGIFCVGCNDSAAGGGANSADIHTIFVTYDGASLNWNTEGYDLDYCMNKAGRTYRYALLY